MRNPLRFFDLIEGNVREIDFRQLEAARAAAEHTTNGALRELKDRWQHRELLAIYTFDKEGRMYLHFADTSYCDLIDYLDEVACFHWMETEKQPEFRARLAELRVATKPPHYPVDLFDPKNQRLIYRICPIKFEDVCIAIEQKLQKREEERKRERRYRFEDDD